MFIPRCIPSSAIPEEDIPNKTITKRTFVGIYDHYGQYFVMTYSGALFTLEDLNDDLNLQQDNITAEPNDDHTGNRTLVYDKTLLSTVSLRRVFKPFLAKLQIRDFIIFGCPDAEPMRQIIYTDGRFIYQHALDTAATFTPEDVIRVALPKAFEGLKKIVNVENSVLLVTHAGKLYRYSPYSHTVIRLRCAAQLAVHDLLVLENDLDAAVELMVLDEREDEKVLKIISYPQFKCNYELPLSQHCWLVSQPKSSMNMCYMEGTVDEEYEDHDGNVQRVKGGGSLRLPNAVELKQITELDPMQRFKKLLYRGLIDEAEAFATEANLSLEMIHEHRVRAFVLRISSERNLEALERTLKSFMELLRAVTSPNLLARQRGIDIPDRDMKEKFLLFLRERLNVGDRSQEKLENEWEVLGEIEEYLHRLDTLKIIDSYSLDWQNFVHEQNLVKCCMQMLKTNVQDASLIWSRHSNVIVPYISNRDLKGILSSLPKGTELIDIIHWLRHITPSLLQMHSQFMGIACKWCVDKAKTLESSEMWPENALEFIKTVHSIFSAREFVVA